MSVSDLSPLAKTLTPPTRGRGWRRAGPRGASLSASGRQDSADGGRRDWPAGGRRKVEEQTAAGSASGAWGETARAKWAAASSGRELPLSSFALTLPLSPTSHSCPPCTPPEERSASPARLSRPRPPTRLLSPPSLEEPSSSARPSRPPGSSPRPTRSPVSARPRSPPPFVLPSACPRARSPRLSRFLSSSPSPASPRLVSQHGDAASDAESGRRKEGRGRKERTAASPAEGRDENRPSQPNADPSSLCRGSTSSLSIGWGFFAGRGPRGGSHGSGEVALKSAGFHLSADLSVSSFLPPPARALPLRALPSPLARRPFSPPSPWSPFLRRSPLPRSFFPMLSSLVRHRGQDRHWIDQDRHRCRRRRPVRL